MGLQPALEIRGPARIERAVRTTQDINVRHGVNFGRGAVESLLVNPHDALTPPAKCAAEPGQALRLRIPPNARFSRPAREELRTFAGRLGIGPNDLEEFIFAVGEALANAIEHSGSSDVIEVRCDYDGDKIVATIIDSGGGFRSNPLTSVVLPDAFAERGRGLAIMRRCTDIFALHSVPGRGTAIVLGRYLRNRSDQEQSIAS